jgi:hypothetical protein
MDGQKLPSEGRERDGCTHEDSHVAHPKSLAF